MWIRANLGFALILLILSCSDLPLHAESRAVITVSAAGEGYQGPPEFNVLADGKVIGHAKLRQAVDTETGQHLDLSENALPFQIERFEFSVDLIENIDVIEVEYFNDIWAGPGKTGDRNLYVTELSVQAPETPTNHIRFGPRAFELVVEDPGTTEITQQYIALYANGKLRLQRPKEGWLRGLTVSPPVIATPHPEQLREDKGTLSPPTRPVLGLKHAKRKTSPGTVTESGTQEKPDTSTAKASSKVKSVGAKVKPKKKIRSAAKQKKLRKATRLAKKAKAKTAALRVDKDKRKKSTKKKHATKKKSVVVAKGKRPRKRRAVAETYDYYDPVPAEIYDAPFYDAPFIVPARPNFARFELLLKRKMRRGFRARRFPVWAPPYY